MLKAYVALIVLLFAALSVKAQVTFKGGSSVLDAFIANHIVYPEYSRQNCIGATIKIAFKVDQKGNVNDVRVQQGLGIDLDDEAVRVVKLTSGQWLVPANYNTGNTIILPINFTPDYSHCQMAPANREQAVMAYKNRQALEDVITNYYKNKYEGKVDPTKEPDILRLKEQLGFDDTFIGDLLDEANAKLKQGDKEGACHDWTFIHNIGSNKADAYLARYCK